jgi:hypothetical protein
VAIKMDNDPSLYNVSVKNVSPRKSISELTGILELDTEILSHLDRDELLNLYDTNSYLRNLIENIFPRWAAEHGYELTGMLNILFDRGYFNLFEILLIAADGGDYEYPVNKSPEEYWNKLAMYYYAYHPDKLKNVFAMAPQDIFWGEFFKFVDVEIELKTKEPRDQSQVDRDTIMAFLYLLTVIRKTDHPDLVNYLEEKCERLLRDSVLLPVWDLLTSCIKGETERPYAKVLKNIINNSGKRTLPNKYLYFRGGPFLDEDSESESS